MTEYTIPSVDAQQEFYCSSISSGVSWAEHLLRKQIWEASVPYPAKIIALGILFDQPLDAVRKRMPVAEFRKNKRAGVSLVERISLWGVSL